MRKLSIYLFVLSFCFLSSVKSVMAVSHPQKVVDEFMHNLLKDNRKSLKTYLFDGVYIPEINKDSPVSEYVLVPTPQRKDTILVVAFFEGEVRDDRVAFIWELVVKNDKISRIETIHNSTIPLLEEAKLVKEYELKFQKKLLVPVYFPFEITDFDGYLDNDFLNLTYRSESINGMLKISVSPVVRQLKNFKTKQDELHTLKDGTKVLYRTNNPVEYGIIFQKDGLQYSIGIGNKGHLKKKFSLNDLLQIADSMN